MNHEVTDYATNFRKIRHRLGFSQTALAFQLDIPQAVIYRIENNKKRIDMELINKMAEAINKPAEEVFRELNGGVPIKPAAMDTHNGKEPSDYKTDVEYLKNLYERLLDEKDRYIKLLERQLRMPA